VEAATVLAKVQIVVGAGTNKALPATQTVQFDDLNLPPP
jgi:hypothetical protein